MTTGDEAAFWRSLTEAFEAAVRDAGMDEQPQHGTSMHYPSCRRRSCTGCIPDAPEIVRTERPSRRPFDPSIFGPPPAVDRYARALREAARHCTCPVAASGEYLTIREHSVMCPLYHL
jgi:hypothetical protein